MRVAATSKDSTCDALVADFDLFTWVLCIGDVPVQVIPDLPSISYAVVATFVFGVLEIVDGDEQELFREEDGVFDVCRSYLLRGDEAFDLHENDGVFGRYDSGSRFVEATVLSEHDVV